MAVSGVYFLRLSRLGSKVSALLSRMPIGVGYQPTLSTRASQERIAIARKGSITL